MLPELLDVDPRTLRLPQTRLEGADPGKFQRQLSRHGLSTVGMPRLVVVRCSDGELMILDGATRATRVARFLPGQTVPVAVINVVAFRGSLYPTIEERLP